MRKMKGRQVSDSPWRIPMELSEGNQFAIVIVFVVVAIIIICSSLKIILNELITKVIVFTKYNLHILVFILISLFSRCQATMLAP